MSHIEVLSNKLVYCAPLFDYADEIIPLYAITAMTINAMIHNNIQSPNDGWILEWKIFSRSNF